MRDRNPAAVVHDTRSIERAGALSEPQLGLGVAFGIYAVVLLWLTLTGPFTGRRFLAVTDVLGFLPPILRCRPFPSSRPQVVWTCAHRLGAARRGLSRLGNRRHDVGIL